jgi:aryl-alcohol dehydrogenase-like predicted oxidoreductase
MKNKTNLPQRVLGQSELKVSAIGLGTWQFSEGKGAATGYWQALNTATTRDIVTEALAQGINWFDTAAIYGNGRSERGLAKSLYDLGIKQGEVIIATKWFPLLRRASSIKSSFKKREEMLAPYKIDLHQIHFRASLSSVEGEMDAMADLLDEGKIEAIGVSNYKVKDMLKAHNRLKERGFTLASNQVHYSLLCREIETNGILEAAKQNGISLIAYSPLEMGILSGRFHNNHETLNKLSRVRRRAVKSKIKDSAKLVAALLEIASRHSVTAAQVALNWVCNFHGETIVAIPGASSVSHATVNAAALSFNLSDDEFARLDELSVKFK